MGIASLVLGIISVIVGFIPLCGTWAIIPAIVGLILGLVDISKKKKAGLPKGKSIAGVVCSIIAILIIIFYITILGSATKSVLESEEWDNLSDELTDELENVEDLQDQLEDLEGQLEDFEYDE